MNQLNELEILLKHLIDFERLKYIQRQELFSLLDQPDITLNTFLNSLPQRAQTFKSQQKHLQTPPKTFPEPPHAPPHNTQGRGFLISGGVANPRLGL